MIGVEILSVVLKFGFRLKFNCIWLAVFGSLVSDRRLFCSKMGSVNSLICQIGKYKKLFYRLTIVLDANARMYMPVGVGEKEICNLNEIYRKFLGKTKRILEG